MFTRDRLTRWTKSLRNNGHLQIGGRLMSPDGKQCCLGHLAVLEGIPHEPDHCSPSSRQVWFKFPGCLSEDAAILKGTLAEELGDPTGCFDDLKMPHIQYGNNEYLSLTSSNDGGVPWVIIADHLDKYYPCSDEVQDPLKPILDKVLYTPLPE